MSTNRKCTICNKKLVPGKNWWLCSVKNCDYRCIKCECWRRIESRHGITSAEFKKIWKHQGGKCANQACRKKLTKKRQNGCHIDHDYITQKVRGLLCGPCNHDLAAVEKDSGEYLKGLQNYLIAYPTQVLGLEILPKDGGKYRDYAHEYCKKYRKKKWDESSALKAEKYK